MLYSKSSIKLNVSFIELLYSFYFSDAICLKKKNHKTQAQQQIKTSSTRSLIHNAITILQNQHKADKHLTTMPCIGMGYYYRKGSTQNDLVCLINTIKTTNTMVL